MSDEVQFDDREFQRRMAEYFRRAPQEALAELHDSGEAIIADAQVHCPVEWGTLQGSGTVDDSRLDQGEVTMGFNTNYAAAVHENMDAHHSQGEAKFLENAVKRGVPKVGQRVAGRLQKLQ